MVLLPIKMYIMIHIIIGSPIEISFLCLCYLWILQMGVSKNNGIPQIIHLFIGFSMIFTIHFGGFTPIFGNTQIQKKVWPLFDVQLITDIAFARHKCCPSSWQVCWMTSVWKSGKTVNQTQLGGGLAWFFVVFVFIILFGEMIQFDNIIFFRLVSKWVATPIFSHFQVGYNYKPLTLIIDPNFRPGISNLVVWITIIFVPPTFGEMIQFWLNIFSDGWWKTTN